MFIDDAEKLLYLCLTNILLFYNITYTEKLDNLSTIVSLIYLFFFLCVEILCLRFLVIAITDYHVRIKISFATYLKKNSGKKTAGDTQNNRRPVFEVPN